MQMDELAPSAHHDSEIAPPPASEPVNEGNADIEMDQSDDDSKPFAWHLRQKNALPASDETKAEEIKVEEEAPAAISAEATKEAAVKSHQQAPKFVTQLGAGGKSRMGANTNGTKAVALPPRPPPIVARSSRQKSQPAAPKPVDSASAVPSSSWPMEPQNNGASPLMSASPVEGTTATLQASISQGLDTASRQLTGTQNDHKSDEEVEEKEKAEMSPEEDEEQDGNGETSKRRVVEEEDE